MNILNIPSDIIKEILLLIPKGGSYFNIITSCKFLYNISKKITDKKMKQFSLLWGERITSKSNEMILIETNVLPNGWIYGLYKKYHILYNRPIFKYILGKMEKDLDNLKYKYTMFIDYEIDKNGKTYQQIYRINTNGKHELLIRNPDINGFNLNLRNNILKLDGVIENYLQISEMVNTLSMMNKK